MNGHYVRGGCKTLWSSVVGSYLNGNQVVDLSEPISAQYKGVVLHWQSYTPGSGLNNWDHNYCFVPKTHVSEYPGAGVYMIMAGGNSIVTKYVYVRDSQLVGNDNNAKSSLSFAGLTIDTRRLALTEVLGV